MGLNGNNNEKEDVSIFVEIQCYVSYMILIMFGYLRDFLRKTGIERNRSAVEVKQMLDIFEAN
jgi:hypothetical protein